MKKSQVQQNPTSTNGIKDGPIWPSVLIVLFAVILVGVGICIELWRLDSEDIECLGIPSV